MAGRPKSKAAAAALGVSVREYASANRNGRIAKLAATAPKIVAEPMQKPAVRPATAIPDVLDAQFGAALAAAAEGGSDMNLIFEELRKEAMRFALEVMRMELDPDERSFNKLMSVKQQITTAVLTATTRVRPGDLREREDDGMGKLLAQLRGGPGVVTEADLLD